MVSAQPISSSELEVKAGSWFPLPDGRAAHDQRGGKAQRRRLLRAAVLRGAATDHLGAGWLGAPPLPPLRPSAHRVHRLRPADRTHPRRDRRGALEAPARPRPEPERLVAALERLDLE